MTSRLRSGAMALAALVPVAAAAQITPGAVPQTTIAPPMASTITPPKAPMIEFDASTPPEKMTTMSMPEPVVLPSAIDMQAPPVFKPKWTPTGSPVVLNDWLVQTYQIDLDTNRATGAATADLWFEAIDLTHFALRPRNGAKISVLPTGGGPAMCGSQPLTGGAVPLPVAPMAGSVPMNVTVCVLTNGGHMGFVQVRDIRISPVRPQGWTGNVPPRAMDFMVLLFTA